MYLHIGQDWLVPYAAIIGIFRLTLIESSPEFRYHVQQMRSEGRLRGDSIDAKSVILTEEFLYFSTISTITLMKRSQRGLVELE